MWYTELFLHIVFPGTLFIFVLSILLAWFSRKTIARIENRVGPPFMQPMYDVTKLLAKERVYPKSSNQIILHYMPMVQVFTAILMSFFIPIYGKEGLLSFEGDLFFFLFLLAIHGMSAFIIGWASLNPYSLSGAGRAVLTEISFELPLAISLSGMAILTKSMRISVIADRVLEQSFNITYGNMSDIIISGLLILTWFILLVTAIFSGIGALEMAPFSAAHAETEIVAGWNTELTGSDLAMTKIADMVNLFNISAIITTIYLGGPVLVFQKDDGVVIELLSYIIAVTSFIILIMLITFIISFIHTISSRLRIDQIIEVLWSYFLPMSIVSIALILITFT
jgi:NADH-quinone oxidoreductase subunit H